MFSALSKSKAAILSLLKTQKPLCQVRQAHKKAGGSKTYMKDSIGRRLGPKKHEGEEVHIGQIIMRQRGTRWYPGSNVGIGKDHTLFALEPGYVRYYLDPFHPKRKFIGVALKKEDALPYSHFDPTPRRLGRSVIENESAAKREEEWMSRKESLALPSILKAKAIRDEKRAKRVAELSKKLAQLIPEIKGDSTKLSLAANRMCSVDRFLRGGKNLEDARFYTTYNYDYDLKLQRDARGEVSPDKYAELKAQYEELANLVDSKVMLDAEFKLVQNLTPEQLEQKKQVNIAQLKSLIPDLTSPVNKKVEKQALALIDDSCFSLSERVHLKRHFLKPVLPEKPELLGTKDTKHTVAINRMNYEKRAVETIYRTKNSFLP